TSTWFDASAGRGLISTPAGRVSFDQRDVQAASKSRLDGRVMSRFIVQAVALATGMVLVAAGQSSAFNYVSDANGTFWGFQDVAPPRVDTGSIRATQIGAGQSPAYSTTINGYGGIKVWVSTAPRFNGELMRG